ncbi:MAG: hypothetical protein WAV05_04875 [Anaerolineales bacterium]
MLSRFSRTIVIATVVLLLASLTAVSTIPVNALKYTTDSAESAQITDDVHPDDIEPVGVPTTGEVVPTFNYPDSVLWDNGPLVTHPAACTGMDASRLQTDLGMSTFGFGHQFSGGNRMADDFTILDPAGWEIDAITFFAYQTSAPITPSPITGVYYQIWDGPPNDPGSSVVFGNLVTNRLQNSVSFDVQRDSGTSPCADNRYIFTDVASAGLTLSAGTYWIEWMTDGSAAYSGPWAPPITILGQTTTGNALQYTSSTGWAAAQDQGTSTPQGMPFIIDGSIHELPAGAVYLPLAMNHFPITPEAPVLNPISNTDGDGNYTVSWSSSVGATGYSLEEDDNAGFSSPTTVYSGPSTSKDITGKDLGIYYYRVKAYNAYAESDWSNIESVEVTVEPPDCPQAGAWSGTTSQGRNIHFEVENSPSCRIKANSLSISIHDSCGYNTTTTFAQSHAITDNHFDTGEGSVRVIGDFSSTTTVDGTFSMNMVNPFPPPYNCTASGTWTATP